MGSNNLCNVGGLIALGLLFSLGAGGANAEEPWRVEKASGAAWKVVDGAPARVAQGEMVSVGVSLRTGATGRVLLSRGQETMLLGANTAIDLVEGKSPEKTTVLQQAGSLALEVERKGEPHFDVETPYLVAAVKGTRFTVTVGPKDAQVGVTRGLVQVSALKSGLSAGVHPGQRATVSVQTAALSVAGPGPRDPIVKGEARAAEVEPLAVPRAGLVSPFAPRAGRRAVRSHRPLQPAAAAAAAPEGNPAMDPVVQAKAPATETAAAPASARPGRRTIWTPGELNRGPDANAPATRP